MKIPENKFKALLSIYAAFLIATGLVFFALPTATLDLYGAALLSALESILAQSLGAVMVGLGVVCWSARSQAKQRGPLMLGLIVTSCLWTVVCVRAGVLFPGHWFFWAEGAGFALVALMLMGVWYGGGSVT